MGHVVIVRGISGAGKSTFIKENYPGASVVGTAELSKESPSVSTKTEN